MGNKLTKLKRSSIVIITASLVPIISSLFPKIVDILFVISSFSNIFFALYYFQFKTQVKFYFLIIFAIFLVSISILNSFQLYFPTAILSSVSANLMLFFGLVFKPRFQLKAFDIYQILLILILLVFAISIISLIFLKTALISFLGFQLHSFYLVLFLFSLISDIKNSRILKLVIITFAIYSIFFFVQKTLDPAATISFKIFISLLSLIFLAIFDYRKITNFSSIRFSYSKIKLNISKLSSFTMYVISILILPISILLVALNSLNISRSFSALIRITSFRAMLASISESAKRFLFGFGPGSTTERFDLTEFLSFPVPSDEIDQYVSVASHSMPIELIYEFGFIFSFIISVLFVLRIINLNRNISLISKLYFLYIYLAANIVYPVLSTSVYPINQSFLILLIIVIQYKPKIIND